MELESHAQVHVPARRVGLGYDYPSAMVECRFIERDGRKGIVDNIPGTPESKSVDLRVISRKLGIHIVVLGDFVTEANVLEPLAASIASNTHLVLMPEFVWVDKVRTLSEFETFWRQRGPLISHLVLLGHGDGKGLIFGESSVEPAEFVNALAAASLPGQAPAIISLCCKSGNGVFGKAVSGEPKCRFFIGPSGAIHAANAALFYQSLLSHSLLEGRSNSRSYQLARVFTPGATEFNMWRKKKLTPKNSAKKVLGHI